MSRYLGPRLRITRRLGHLSGLTRKKPPFKPLNPVNPFGPKKIIPPGQHGRNKSFKKKPYESCEYDYLIRLKLKQRLRYHYGLTEKQLVRYVEQAKKIKGSTGRVLLRLLEMRLDNIVFRLHMAPTIKAARQLINHGHILVNKKKVTIPSYQCEPKDIITVAPKIISMELVSRFLNEFDREKSRYERLLKILEFGRKGTTMSLKTQKSLLTTKKSMINKTQKLSNVQSLKIGSMLNITINNKGRNEAEAISYAFGKMIVIHPYFFGRQSLNKNISVVIYKKSRNNKILYTYPANPFYLHLENLRKLNSLDIAKIFNNSMNKISIIKKQSKSAAKLKTSRSALIVMNGAKVLGNTRSSVAQRKTRITQNNINSNSDNQQVRSDKSGFSKEFSPSIFVRIIAAKCFNKKAKQKLLNISNLKTLRPNLSKDPVAYREKYVYTKTSRALRLFGTRFYGKILKTKKEKTSTMDRRRSISGSLGGSSNIKNTVNNTKAHLVTLKDKNWVKPYLPSTSLFHNKNVPVTFKSQQLNPNIGTIPNTLVTTPTLEAMSNCETYQNLPVFVNNYKTQINKLATLSKSTLTAKILNNFLYESKNQSFNVSSFHDFIFVVFSKLAHVLPKLGQFGSEKNLNFKIENILDISKNFNSFFKTQNFETQSIKSTKFSIDLLVLSLKLKQAIKVIQYTKQTGNVLLDFSGLTNTIQKNISLSLMLDKIKNMVETTVKFASSFLSTDVVVPSITLYFNKMFSFIFKAEKMIKDILINSIGTIKTLLMLSKVNSLNKNINENVLHQLVLSLTKRTTRVYKKLINFSMGSIQKAGLLEALGSNLLYSDMKNFTYSEYVHKQTNLLEKYSLYSSKNQNIEILKTLNYLMKYNLLNSSKIDLVTKSMNTKMENIPVILAYFKQKSVDQAKFNFLNSTLVHQRNLADKIEQKIWFEQLSQTFEQKLSKKQLKCQALVCEKLQLTEMLENVNFKLNLVNKYDQLLSKINRLKDFNLIKSTNYSVFTNLLKSHFNSLTILSFGSTIYFSKYNLFNSIAIKTVNKISQLLAKNSSVFKVLYLSKQQKLNATLTIESFNQNIVKAISLAKTNFIKELLLEISKNSDLAGFFNPFIDNRSKDFNFVTKLNQITCLYKLRKLNLLEDQIFTQLVTEMSEKLAVKQLNQTNLVLSSYLNNKTKLENFVEILSLDKFSGNSVLSLSSSSFSSNSVFWKKLSISVTPNLLEKGLANLKQLNLISGDKYSHLLVKFNNLYTQYRTLGLKANKKYLTEKFRILKTLLIFVSRNLIGFAFSKFKVFNQSNNWANNVLLKLGLQKQKQIKTSGSLLNKEKTNYVLNIKKLGSSAELIKLGFFVNNYIEMQYKSLYRNVLITSHIDNNLSEKIKVLKSVKLYLLRYKFIIENQQIIYTSNSRMLALKKQTSLLVDKNMYQNLKNSLNEILSMNFESLIQSKDFIVVYLMQELKTKLAYKLNLQSKYNLLTDSQIHQFHNTFMLLTSPDALVNLSQNLLLTVDLVNKGGDQQTNLSHQTYLKQKIFKFFKSGNLSVCYNALYNNSLVLDTNLDKVYFFAVLHKLKIELNKTKLKVLLMNYNEQAELDLSVTKSLNLKLHSAMYKTLTNLCLLEKAVSLNKDFVLSNQSLMTKKQAFLTEFNQILSYMIYMYNLNLLKDSDLLSEQIYEQFKTNYETIFKLVKKEAIVISELNKRKKWKFINYATYQTLFKTISENLTMKILSLLQRTEKSSLQQQSKHISTSSSILQELIQQTLEQLVNTSESTPTDFSSFIYGFVQKTSLINNLVSASQSKRVKVSTIFSNINMIKTTLQSLVAIEKKFQVLGPWGSKEKMLLQKQQKLRILQTLISNVHKQECFALKRPSNLFTISNKYKQILLINEFSVTHRKNWLKPIYNLSDVTPHQLSKQAKQTLVSQLETLQLNFKKENGSKLTNNLLNLQNEPPTLSSLNIYKNSIFGLLQKTKLLELDMNQTLKFEDNLSKFQTTQFFQNMLMQKLFFSTVELNLLKRDSANLFTYIFTVMPFKHRNNSQLQSFITSSNLQKLVSSGILSSTMANTIQKKMQLQVKKQNFRKIIYLLKTLQKLNYTSLTKFNTFVYYTKIIELFSCLSQLKQAKAISERKYVAIKQKVKLFSLFSNLNYKLLAVNETDSVKTELKKQLLQKLLQKLKQAKTVTQFKQNLKSVSSLRKDLAIVETSKKQSTKLSQLLFKLLKSRGRWAKVSVHQLATQKLITTRQQEKLNTIIDNQNVSKMRKLRHLIMVFDYCRTILQNQPNSMYTKANTELLQEVITSVLRSFTGPWRNVLVNLLYKNNFISKNSVVKYLSTVENIENTNRGSLANSDARGKSGTLLSTKMKLHRLLGIYFRQFKALLSAQKTRTIINSEFEQKLSSILSNILIILEKGDFSAFKIIYNSKWLNQLGKIETSVSAVGVSKKAKSNKVSSPIRDFVTTYNLVKEKYLPTYKNYILSEKMKVFKVYKNNLFQELLTLKQKVKNFATNESINRSYLHLNKSEQFVSEKQSFSPFFEITLLLNTTRLNQFKAQGLISLKTYKKLKSILNISLQRLTKVDKLFALQNLYSLTDDYKSSIENSNSNSDYTYDSSPGKIQFQFELNVKKTREQYINLIYKIILSYLKSEYKQIEKMLIKQKLLLQRLKNTKLKQKRIKQFRNLKTSKFSSSEQFNNFFKQLLNFLDSRYKSGGRNRRNPRINTIIRRLNQQLSFDKTLTQKFGEHLQMFIDKRFGPALPLPPHLELKRWKIKTSKLQSKQKSNLKYLILPVGIVRDLAPRRSVGLPILERFIIEYYSRK
uniref:Small ribosomal subunit protein uS4c n=1 Tax=Chaetophoropsis pisiformis TaxID=1675661 RepID=A0A6M3U8X9_9CHLO|nr:ribosomal protein S4 [Chaetophoropsis pisiformis]